MIVAGIIEPAIEALVKEHNVSFVEAKLAIALHESLVGSTTHVTDPEILTESILVIINETAATPFV